ncbi:methylthioribose kinase [Domibacillus sp. A3M-37]|uniref:DUF7147 family protein n=1 Tax=Domibacillus TaxID=1433999 RepID=UPI000618305B|nr:MULTISPECIES: hypothetical protein [Domibacillus]MCP3761887.1 methylthioribose kinase [Domibacillus sp. A3M-37]
MIQRFIELGEGYSDLYELIDIAERSNERIAHFIALHSNEATSCAIILHPTSTGSFQPIYVCREGIPNPHKKENERFRLFEQTAASIGKPVIEMDVKPSVLFAEKTLYYQYLIGILRINHYLPPLS